MGQPFLTSFFKGNNLNFAIIGSRAVMRICLLRFSIVLASQSKSSFLETKMADRSSTTWILTTTTIRSTANNFLLINYTCLVFAPFCAHGLSLPLLSAWLIIWQEFWIVADGLILLEGIWPWNIVILNLKPPNSRISCIWLTSRVVPLFSVTGNYFFTFCNEFCSRW